MKKLFFSFLLILFLSGCVQNMSEWNKKSWGEKEYNMKIRDRQFGMNDGEKYIIYLGTFSDLEEKYINHAYNVNPLSQLNLPVRVVAKNQCEKLFNSLSFNEIGIYEPIKDEIKTKKLHYKKYTKYECLNPEENLAKIEDNGEKSSFSNNTKKIRFTCSFANRPSEKSKIFIDGPEAYEITAIGVQIKYSNVNLSDKGAFSLQGASNDPGRAWFIGSQSFLLLDTDMLPYNCN